MSDRGGESKYQDKNPSEETLPKLPYQVPAREVLHSNDESPLTLHRGFSVMRLADENGPLEEYGNADATNGNLPELNTAASPATSLFWPPMDSPNSGLNTGHSFGEDSESKSKVVLAEPMDSHSPVAETGKEAQGSGGNVRNSDGASGRKKVEQDSPNKDSSPKLTKVLSERAVPATIPPVTENSEGNLDDRCDYYSFTQDDVEKTNITNWYFKFSAVTQKTIFIPIPPSFLEYLNSPFCNLPKNTVTSVMAPLGEQSPSTTPMSSSYDSSTSQELVRIKEPNRDFESSSDDEENCLIYKPMQTFEKFDEMDNKIEAAILELGGSVLPKLNWKSPKDAVWIGFNKSVRCYMPGDIYLLFKASEHITQVLSEPYKGCKDFNGTPMPPTLVLREWLDISPAIEFRCFVVQRFLVGISQRDVSGCYPSISDQRDTIISDIYDFYRKTMFRTVEMSHYVFDVIHCGKDDVKLIDMNVFGLVTDPLLFNYRELEWINAEVVVENETTLRQARPQPEDLPKLGDMVNAFVFGNPTFRFIERPGSICAHPYLSSGAPKDLRI